MRFRHWLQKHIPIRLAPREHPRLLLDFTEEIVFFRKQVSKAAVRVKRTKDACNATRAELFWKIEAPASMPPLFPALRIAATLAVIGVVAGELLGVLFLLSPAADFVTV
jgi:hypothetical protein